MSKTEITNHMIDIVSTAVNNLDSINTSLNLMIQIDGVTKYQMMYLLKEK